jgi:hypothetical protein
LDQSQKFEIRFRFYGSTRNHGTDLMHQILQGEKLCHRHYSDETIDRASDNDENEYPVKAHTEQLFETHRSPNDQQDKQEQPHHRRAIVTVQRRQTTARTKAPPCRARFEANDLRFG